jgi:arsenate reductase
MAEGYLRFYGGEDVIVKSAGIEAHGVNRRAIESMKEDGIDISAHTSNLVDEYLSERFDYVITVCDNANEHCPVFPNQAVRLHQNFPDPARATGNEIEIQNSFRHARDLIKKFSQKFVKEYLKK